MTKDHRDKRTQQRNQQKGNELIAKKITRVTVNRLSRDRHALSLSLTGIDKPAIVTHLAAKWQHQHLYGKAYLCKEAVSRRGVWLFFQRGFAFFVTEERPKIDVDMFCSC
ncbi:hypothetical protein D3C81_1822170 [compost metagenome]